MGLEKSLVCNWGRANSFNEDRLAAGLPPIDLSGLMEPPVGHLGVQLMVSNLLGLLKRPPSPHPGPEKVIPTVNLEAWGAALVASDPAFSITMADQPWNNSFAYDHRLKHLFAINPAAEELTGEIVGAIPSQVGDTTSPWPDGGNWFQIDLVTGKSVLVKRRNKKPHRSFRGAAVRAKTKYKGVFFETDTHNPLALGAWDNFVLHIPLPCFSIVETGNRSPHSLFVMPAEEKLLLKGRVGDMLLMMGNDPTGWNGGLTRLGNTGRGKARDGQPATQTTIWLSPVPSYLNPDPQRHSWDQIEALFEKAVLANKAAIEAECDRMEAAIAELRKRTQGEPKTSQAKGTRTASPTRATTGGSSAAMEVRQTNGGKAYRFLRARLCQQLDAAGDKLVLLPALHAALAQETAEKCDLDLADAEGILDEVCAHPHPAEGNHAAGPGVAIRTWGTRSLPAR